MSIVGVAVEWRGRKGGESGKEREGGTKRSGGREKGMWGQRREWRLGYGRKSK